MFLSSALLKKSLWFCVSNEKTASAAARILNVTVTWSHPYSFKSRERVISKAAFLLISMVTNFSGILNEVSLRESNSLTFGCHFSVIFLTMAKYKHQKHRASDWWEKIKAHLY